MTAARDNDRTRAELDAMKTIYDTMRRLTHQERDRVMGWVSARLAADRVGKIAGSPVPENPFEFQDGPDTTGLRCSTCTHGQGRHAGPRNQSCMEPGCECRLFAARGYVRGEKGGLIDVRTANDMHGYTTGEDGSAP